MNNRIVVALGGNALGKNLEEQMKAVKVTSSAIIDLLEKGYEVVVSHGNGPQVGLISDVFEHYHMSHNINHFKMSVCVSMSQGLIGYDLQNALREELLNRNMNIPVSTVITQVVVDENDPAFLSPTKPVGPFHTKEEAEFMISQGETVIEDSGRGYRKVVPSPKPLYIVEKDTIKALLKDKQLVIACGGGGIPVVEQGNHLKGVEAVIDKDFASAKLAELVEADTFVILTAVEKVAINFGKENEKWLDTLNFEEIDRYIKEEQFAKGSMLPKVEAARQFAQSKAGRKTIITLLEKVKDGLEGKTGTVIKGA